MIKVKISGSPVETHAKKVKVQVISDRMTKCSFGKEEGKKEEDDDNITLLSFSSSHNMMVHRGRRERKHTRTSKSTQHVACHDNFDDCSQCANVGVLSACWLVSLRWQLLSTDSSYYAEVIHT